MVEWEIGAVSGRVGLYTIVLRLFSAPVTVSTYLSVVCHHFCCSMLLFQGHVAYWNFTLTGPHFGGKKCANELQTRPFFLSFSFSFTVTLLTMITYWKQFSTCLHVSIATVLPLRRKKCSLYTILIQGNCSLPFRSCWDKNAFRQRGGEIRNDGLLTLLG